MKFDTPVTAANPIDHLKVVGRAHDRVEGKLKTTGTATYAHEHHNVVENVAYGYVLGAAIAKGRIASIDIKEAKASPGVVGGARVALVSVFVEAVGLMLMWLAPSASMAAAGAALTGFGYSLVYPGLGVEAVRLAPPESRGVAMGAYTACLDIALGVSGPVLGLVAGGAGLNAVFFVGALVVLSSAAIAIRLQRKRFGPVATA